MVTKLPFHNVLDAGTGNGALVRLMRDHGERCRLHVCRLHGSAHLRQAAHGGLRHLVVSKLWRVLRQLRDGTATRCAGKSAWGIELSEAVLKSECPDLLEKKVTPRVRASQASAVARPVRETPSISPVQALAS